MLSTFLARENVPRRQDNGAPPWLDQAMPLWSMREIQLATWIAALHHEARQPSVGAKLMLNGDEGLTFLPWQKVWRVLRLCDKTNTRSACAFARQRAFGEPNNVLSCCKICC